MLDNIDLHILKILQKEARTPNAEIARQVGMAPSAVFERIRKLEQSGVILGYETRISPKALDLDMLAFIAIVADDLGMSGETEAALMTLPEVQELHHVTGDDSLLIKVRVANTAALDRLLREGLRAVPGIRSTRTTVVLSTDRETTQLPMPEEG